METNRFKEESKLVLIIITFSLWLSCILNGCYYIVDDYCSNNKINAHSVYSVITRIK